MESSVVLLNHLQLFKKNPRVNICSFQHYRQLRKASEDGGFEKIFNLSLSDNIKHSQSQAKIAVLPFYIQENEMSLILINFTEVRQGLLEYLIVTREKKLEIVYKLIFRISEMANKLLLNDLWRNKEQVLNTEDFIVQDRNSHQRNMITSCLLSKLCEREMNFNEMKNILYNKHVSSLEFGKISSIIAASRTFSVMKFSPEESRELSNVRVVSSQDNTEEGYPRVKSNILYKQHKSRLFLEEKHRVNPVLDSSWEDWGVSVPKYRRVRSRDPTVEMISNYYIGKMEKTADSFHHSLIREKRLSGILSQQVQEDKVKTSKLKRKLCEQEKKLDEFSRIVKHLKLKLRESETEKLKSEIISSISLQTHPLLQFSPTSSSSAGADSGHQSLTSSSSVCSPSVQSLSASISTDCAPGEQSPSVPPTLSCDSSSEETLTRGRLSRLKKRLAWRTRHQNKSKEKVYGFLAATSVVE